MDGVALRRDLRLLQEKVAGVYRFENIIGKSAAMQRVFDVIRKVADTDLTVLVRGPSGTGKELVANAIHHNSPHRQKPMIKGELRRVLARARGERAFRSRKGLLHGRHHG